MLNDGVIVGMIKGFEWMVLLTVRVTWIGERDIILDMVIIHYEAVITFKPTPTPSLICPRYFCRRLMQLFCFVRNPLRHRILFICDTYFNRKTKLLRIKQKHEFFIQ